MSTFEGFAAEFPDIRIDYFFNSNSLRAPLAYFLSHVHTDHTKGLETYRAPAFIYCSAATKELLLRMEKYSNRTNFNHGILEAKRIHFKHLRSVLRSIPLNTPTQLVLSPGNEIRVTLFDANHCPGAVMFLIEGLHKAILYTGDIRAEKWWIDAFIRNPVMIPYASGIKNIDTLYLDTTHASRDEKCRSFPSKASGLRYLIEKISEYPAATVFYLNTWTLGYEEVWTAIATCFSSRIHVDRYKSDLYTALSAASGTVPHAESSLINGCEIGGCSKPGYLTLEDARFHSCDPECASVESSSAVCITPVISHTLQELGAPLTRLIDNQSSKKENIGASVIAFPFARHSSYEELCEFVASLMPRDIYPCVVDKDNWTRNMSMETLFGHLCADKNFAFDRKMELYLEGVGDPLLAEEMDSQITGGATVKCASQISALLSSPLESPMPTIETSNTESEGEPSREPQCSPKIDSWRRFNGGLKRQNRSDVSPPQPRRASTITTLTKTGLHPTEGPRYNLLEEVENLHGKISQDIEHIEAPTLPPSLALALGNSQHAPIASTSARQSQRQRAYLAATDENGEEWAAMSTLSSSGKYEKEVELS